MASENLSNQNAGGGEREFHSLRLTFPGLCGHVSVVRFEYVQSPGSSPSTSTLSKYSHADEGPRSDSFRIDHSVLLSGHFVRLSRDDPSIL